MKRIPEPELMEDPEQTLAYSNADFSSSNKLFIQYILQNKTNDISTVLDLGCGPGDVDIDLAKKSKNTNILAIDGSSRMIRIAKQKIEENNLANRIEVKVDKLPHLNIPTGTYDAIISKDLLHHLPDPRDFWQEVTRLSTDKTIVFVMDLIRPHSRDEARNIVDAVCPDEPEVLRNDLYNSLLAAFTIDEINEQLNKSDLKYRIQTLGERHFVLICGKTIT